MTRLGVRLTVAYDRMKLLPHELLSLPAAERVASSTLLLEPTTAPRISVIVLKILLFVASPLVVVELPAELSSQPTETEAYGDGKNRL